MFVSINCGVKHLKIISEIIILFIQISYFNRTLLAQFASQDANILDRRICLQEKIAVKVLLLGASGSKID